MKREIIGTALAAFIFFFLAFLSNFILDSIGSTTLGPIRIFSWIIASLVAIGIYEWFKVEEGNDDY